MFQINTHIGVRIGAGMQPTVITTAKSTVTDGMNSEVTGIEILDVELFQSEGNLAEVRDRLMELLPPTTNRARYNFDLAVDLTTDPAFKDMLSADGYYQIQTGSAGEEQQYLDFRLGRLFLLSNLKAALSRGLVTFKPNDEWPDVKSALTDVTAKSPKMEQEGLLVTDTTLNDDIALSIALTIWRASHHRPIDPSWDEPIDYPELNIA